MLLAVTLRLEILALLIISCVVHCYLSTSTDFIVHENNPMFSDGHSALELSIDTALIVEVGVQICKNPIVSRQHVKWEHNKITEFQCALNDNTDGFEKVNNLSDMLLANISETTKENVSELVSCVNDLLLCCAKECNMIKVKHYNKKSQILCPDLIIGLIWNARIKLMLSTGQEGDTETTKVRKT